MLLEKNYLPGVRTTYVGQEEPSHGWLDLHFPPATPPEQLCLTALGLPWVPLGSRKRWKKGCGE